VLLARLVPGVKLLACWWCPGGWQAEAQQLRVELEALKRQLDSSSATVRGLFLSATPSHATHPLNSSYLLSPPFFLGLLRCAVTGFSLGVL